MFLRREGLIDFYLLFYSSKYDSPSQETIAKKTSRNNLTIEPVFIFLKTFPEEESRKEAMFDMANVCLLNPFF